MNKLILLIAFFASSLALKAQYGTLNAILDRLEEKRGVNKDLKDVNIDDIKFVLIKDFDDHTERNFVIIKGNKAPMWKCLMINRRGKLLRTFFPEILSVRGII